MVLDQVLAFRLQVKWLSVICPSPFILCGQLVRSNPMFDSQLEYIWKRVRQLSIAQNASLVLFTHPFSLLHCP